MFMGAAVLDERASGKTEVASTEQKGVVIELPQGREALLLQTTYHGPADRFAWVIPVPGKPGKDDVFLAEPAFIEVLLKETAPRVKTHITAPQQRLGEMQKMMQRGAASAPGPAGGEAPGTEAVTVYERFEVGKFDATILAATDAGVLTQWLQRNGYQVPDESADILGHYVRLKWTFVALRMQPAAAAARPVLDDVDPVGIRFPASKLVYPLYISRGSSRQKTALLLFVLSKQPVECDGLPEASLPLDKPQPKGTSYATIRRKAIESAGPSLVTEYRARGGMPYSDLYFDKDAWLPREGRNWSAKELWTTRCWTLLDREQMQDLTFSPSADPRPRQVSIERHGQLRLQPALWWTRERLAWLVVVASLIVAVFILRAGARRGPAGGALAVTLLIALVALAHAGTMGYLSTGTRELDTALKQLDDLMQRFHRTYGCYPEKLKDLVAAAPRTAGVDSSGNPVQIAPPGSTGADADPGELPVDPLTGRRDTWVYEPTGTPMVDSGGFEITLYRGNPTARHDEPMFPLSQESLLDYERHEAGRCWLPESPPQRPFTHPRTERPYTVPLQAGRDVLCKRIPTDKGPRIILAAPQAHAAEIGKPIADISAFAWAPDQNRYVYASGDGTHPWIFRSDVGGSWTKPLTRKPWPVGVIGLAWHPTADKWAVIAIGSQGRPTDSRLYTIGVEGVPQPVGQPGRYGLVEFSPSGRALLAIVGLPPNQPQTRGRGLLRYVPLDGTAPRDIDEEVALQPFGRTAAGCVAVRAHMGADVSLLLIDREDRTRELPLPVTPATVVDTWLGADEVLVALDNHTAKVGEVWSHPLPDGDWRRVARWELIRPGTHSRTGEIALLGRAPQTRSGYREFQPFLLAHPDDGYHVYAIADYLRHPQVEQLSSPDWAYVGPGPTTVKLDRTPIQVLAGRVLWPNAFGAGDLVGATEVTQHPAIRVGKSDQKHIIVGAAEVRLWNEDPLTIPRNASKDCLRQLMPE
jgi:hypothetical protein